MKKAGILILALMLVVAMFTGCRPSPDTTNTTVTPSTSGTTTKAPMPSTPGNTKPSSGIVPDGTNMMPQPTDGTNVTRGHRGPRY